MEYATRETQLRETTLRALDSLWTEVKILRDWRASVERRLDSLESSSHSGDSREAASTSNGVLPHSPSKESPVSPAKDRAQLQASRAESSSPSSFSIAALPANSTGTFQTTVLCVMCFSQTYNRLYFLFFSGFTTVFTRTAPGLGVVLLGASLTDTGADKLQVCAGLADSVRIEWPPAELQEGSSGSTGDLVIGMQSRLYSYVSK